VLKIKTLYWDFVTPFILCCCVYFVGGSAEFGDFDPQLHGNDYLNECHLLPKVTFITTVYLFHRWIAVLYGWIAVLADVDFSSVNTFKSGIECLFYTVLRQCM